MRQPLCSQQPVGYGATAAYAAAGEGAADCKQLTRLMA